MMSMSATMSTSMSATMSTSMSASMSATISASISCSLSSARVRGLTLLLQHVKQTTLAPHKSLEWPSGTVMMIFSRLGEMLGNLPGIRTGFSFFCSETKGNHLSSILSSLKNWKLVSKKSPKYKNVPSKVIWKKKVLLLLWNIFCWLRNF